MLQEILTRPFAIGAWLMKRERRDTGGMGVDPCLRHRLGTASHYTREGDKRESGRAESNCRPPGPKPGALPLGHAPVAGRVGFEAMRWGGEDSFKYWPHSVSVAVTKVRQITQIKLVPPGRLELPFLAPEASTLSAELRGPSLV